MSTVNSNEMEKQIFQKVTSTRHVFINKVKLEEYNNDTRVQTTLMAILPVTD